MGKISRDINKKIRQKSGFLAFLSFDGQTNLQMGRWHRGRNMTRQVPMGHRCLCRPGIYPMYNVYRLYPCNGF